MTLEYDLSETNQDNLDLILNAWEKVHPKKGKDLKARIAKETINLEKN